MTADILVVGGGPAGLAAAIAARQRGFQVILADRSVPPIDKACGEGIMPDGIAAARRLGIELHGDGSYPFRGLRFCHGERSVESPFPAGTGLGIRRTTLHRMMVRRAEEAGVDVRWGARVSCSAGDILVDGTPVTARWIVGADGGQSMVRSWAGLDAVRAAACASVFAATTAWSLGVSLWSCTGATDASFTSRRLARMKCAWC